MRALELTQRFPPALGGVETHVWHLAEGLQRRGVDVEVFTTDLERDRPLRRLRDGAGAFAYPVRRFRAVKVAELPHALGNVAPAMLPGVLTGHWDLVHAHAYGYFPTFAAAAGRLLKRSALVITPHADPGRPSLEKRAFDHVVPRVTLRRADRVIALTERERGYLERLGVPAGRIEVVPNGVELGEFPSRVRVASNGGAVSVLFAGRCYPEQKGLEVLMRAMASLRDLKGVTLRIVGDDWGGHTVIRTMAKNLGIEDAVTLVGRVDRASLIKEYEHADIFVLPSLFDSFPIAILEAMAAGLPVVATRVGGVPDVVEDGRTGILVNAGDADGLAAALLHLAGDGIARRDMGRRGRERASGFSWEAVLPRIQRVYEDAIAERAS